MDKVRSSRGSSTVSSSSAPRRQPAEDERQRMIAEAAYYRAMMRGFQNGSPSDDWFAAEQEINRLLPSPTQQKKEIAAYKKIRADLQKTFAGARETLTADTIRHAVDDARAALRQAGELTVDGVDKAIASLEKEMIRAGHRIGSQIETFSERGADVFSIFRDRSGQWLAHTGGAIADWVRQAAARLAPHIYHTGDIADHGEFECTHCNTRIQLATPAHLPLCPECRKTEFRRLGQ